MFYKLFNVGRQDKFETRLWGVRRNSEFYLMTRLMSHLNAKVLINTEKSVKLSYNPRWQAYSRLLSLGKTLK